MRGYNCTCSRCGLAIRLLKPNTRGPTVRCSKCESLYGVPAEPRGVPEAPQLAAEPKAAPRKPSTLQADNPKRASVGGQVPVDDDWAEVQRRQRKKILAMVLSGLGAIVLIVGIVVIANNSGSKDKKKNGAETTKHDFEVKDAVKDQREPDKPDAIPVGERPPRRDAVADQRPAPPPRRQPEEEEDKPEGKKPPHALGDILADETAVFGYRIRPPRGYSSQDPPGAPSGVSMRTWVGPRRDDGTAAQLIVMVLDPPSGEPELSLEDAVVKLLEGVKRKRLTWEQEPIACEKIDGLNFARTRWKGIDFNTSAKMQGIYYLAKEGKRLIQLSSQDVEPHHEEALAIAEAAVRSFKIK